jgi:hypothetical protein
MRIRTLAFRLLASLTVVLTLGAGLACSGGGNGGGSSGTPSAASQAELCKGLDVVRQDLDTVKQAAESGDSAKANDALDDARTNVAELRGKVRNEPNSAVAQSAGDLVGALDEPQLVRWARVAEASWGSFSSLKFSSLQRLAPSNRFEARPAAPE